MAALPRLAQLARTQVADSAATQTETLIDAWCAANPPFRGPNWACAQEAAFRILHLGLALALWGTDRAPAPGARRLLVVHAQRIAATRAYALAQDNNHPISEAAGLFVCF